MTKDDAARPNAVPWPPLLLVGLAVAAWLAGRAYPLGWPGLDDRAARVIGFGFGIAGILIMAWAVATLWSHKTTVRPDRAAAALVTDGPYAWSRNPIYVADVLILLGIAELTKNVWFVMAAAVFAILVTVLAIGPEERHLAAKFGRDWDAYTERVRRWF
jgi:protein-S-isoprenylcysteine O-methyltransferase Ste14